MAPPLTHYLRTRRRELGLTQEEIAYLLGSKSGSRVSRYECFRRLPELDVALAYGALFQEPMQDLFFGRYLEVAAGVLERARQLKANLSRVAGQERKVEALRVIILILDRSCGL